MLLAATPSFAAEVALVSTTMDLGLATARLQVAEVEAGRTLRFAQLMNETPPTLSQGIIENCIKPVDLAPATDAIQRAQVAIDYRDLVTAAKHLDGAIVAIACSDQYVSGKVAARAHLLRGYLHFLDGDESAATTQFARAHLFQPGQPWDVALPAEPAAAYAKAGSDLYVRAAVRLYVNPDPAVPWWIDGQTPEVDADFYPIPAGTHLLQVGKSPTRSWNLALDSGEANLTLPGLAPPTAADAADDPDQRAALTHWIGVALGDEAEVAVVTPHSIWVHELGSDRWTDAWAPVVDQATTTRRRIQLGWGLAAGGAGLFAGSAIWGATTYAAGARHQQVMNTTTDPALFQTHEEKYLRAQASLPPAWTLTAIGAVTGATGLFLSQHRRVQLYPDLMGNQLLLGVRAPLPVTEP